MDVERIFDTNTDAELKACEEQFTKTLVECAIQYRVRAQLAGRKIALLRMYDTFYTIAPHVTGSSNDTSTKIKSTIEKLELEISTSGALDAMLQKNTE